MVMAPRRWSPSRDSPTLAIIAAPTQPRCDPATPPRERGGTRSIVTAIRPRRILELELCRLLRLGRKAIWGHALPDTGRWAGRSPATTSVQALECGVDVVVERERHLGASATVRSIPIVCARAINEATISSKLTPAARASPIRCRSSEPDEPAPMEPPSRSSASPRASSRHVVGGRPENRHRMRVADRQTSKGLLARDHPQLAPRGLRLETGYSTPVGLARIPRDRGGSPSGRATASRSPASTARSTASPLLLASSFA